MIVSVYGTSESDARTKQITVDFGVNVATLQIRLRRAEAEEDNRPEQTVADAAGARELKRRIRLREQENDVLRCAVAYLSRANLKLGGSPNDVSMPDVKSCGFGVRGSVRGRRSV